MTKKRKPPVLKGFAVKQEGSYLLISYSDYLYDKPVSEIPKGYYQVSLSQYSKFIVIKKLTDHVNAFNCLVHAYVTQGRA